MPLDRPAVMQFVEKHWLRPCDDGQIFSDFGTVNVERERAALVRKGQLPGDGWDAFIIPDVDDKNEVIPEKERACFIRASPSGETIPAPEGTPPPELTGTFDIVPFSRHAGAHDGFEDCAHYLSRCLTKGGIPINHSGVSGLVQDLQTGHHRNATKTLGEKVTRVQGDRIMKTGVMDRGDVIGYFHPAGYSHSTIYTGPDGGVHRITCHSRSRFHAFYDNAEWNITDATNFRYTLIHFADEHYPPSFTKINAEVTDGGRTEIYHFLEKGHVVRELKRSGGSSAFVPAANRGYWFQKRGKLFVFWPVAAQVVEINFIRILNPNTDGSIKILVDDREATLKLVP